MSVTVDRLHSRDVGRIETSDYEAITKRLSSVEGETAESNDRLVRRGATMVAG